MRVTENLSAYSFRILFVDDGSSDNTLAEIQKQVSRNLPVGYLQLSRDGYLVAPAFLVVESRPKARGLKSLVDKCRLDHHRMGTPYCWIVDTEEECAYECHKAMNGMHQLVDTLTAGPDIHLAVAEIFNELRITEASS